MKKFVFQLASLYKIKISQKDQAQAEYWSAKSTLEHARQGEARIREAIADESARYESRARAGMTAEAFQTYACFFQELRQLAAEAAQAVERAERQARRKRSELIAVLKEVKTLEKLRDKQYAEYLAAERKEENKVIDDILSFTVSGAATGGETGE